MSDGVELDHARHLEGVVLHTGRRCKVDFKGVSGVGGPALLRLIGVTEFGSVDAQQSDPAQFRAVAGRHPDRVTVADRRNPAGEHCCRVRDARGGSGDGMGHDGGSNSQPEQCH